MSLRICRIYKLTGNKAVGSLLMKLVCFCDSTLHTLCTVGEDKLSAVSRHQKSALNAHGFGHCDYYLITSCRRNSAETYAGVAACRLNNGCVFIYKAFSFCVIENFLRYSVFDAACGVKVFELYKYFRFKIIFLFII